MCIATSGVEAIRADVAKYNCEFAARFGWDEALPGDAAAGVGVGRAVDAAPVPEEVGFSHFKLKPFAAAPVTGVHYSSVAG